MSDNGPLTLTNVLGIPEAAELDAAILAKAASPRLRDLGDPEIAMRFMRASVRGSYLFNKYVIPAFATEVMRDFRRWAPLNDKLGTLFAGVLDMIRGEMCTNNIFERPGECHAHYYDQLEAYAAAGGDLLEIERYGNLEMNEGAVAAIEQSPLWSGASRQQAMNIYLRSQDDHLCPYIMVAANEVASPLIFARALEYLPKEPRFEKFRTFLAKHVEFDAGDHGPIALQWLQAFLRYEGAPREMLAWSTGRVRDLYIPGRL
jgi:hypothetical protein